MRLKQPLKIEISGVVSKDNKVFSVKRGKFSPTCCSFYFSQPEKSVLTITYGERKLLQKIIPRGKRIVLNKMKVDKSSLVFNIMIDGKMIDRKYLSLHEMRKQRSSSNSSTLMSG